MKNFLKRHSWIVLLIVAIVIAAANYLVYPVFIKSELNLVEIPVAKETIPEATKITDDMLTTISVAKEYLPINIETDKENIVGKYSNKNVTIAPNGFIYGEYLTNDVELYSGTFHALEDGQWAYTLLINTKYNQNDILKENEFVSLYFLQEYKDEDELTKYRVGQIGENVKIINLNPLSAEKQYVTFAIPEADIAYYSVAEKLGEVFPLIDSASDSFKENYAKVYDIGAMRSIIAAQSDIFYKIVEEEPEPVVEEAPIEGAVE